MAPLRTEGHGQSRGGRPSGRLWTQTASWRQRQSCSQYWRANGCSRARRRIWRPHGPGRQSSEGGDGHFSNSMLEARFWRQADRAVTWKPGRIASCPCHGRHSLQQAVGLGAETPFGWAQLRPDNAQKLQQPSLPFTGACWQSRISLMPQMLIMWYGLFVGEPVFKSSAIVLPASDDHRPGCSGSCHFTRASKCCATGGQPRPCVLARSRCQNGDEYLLSLLHRRGSPPLSRVRCRPHRWACRVRATS